MGNDAVGKLSTDGKTMIISGSGTLNVIPSDYKNTLENIIIEDGIEEIPNSFCDGCSKLKNIYIAETVDTMGGVRTFAGCSNLVNITFASSGIYIDSGDLSNMFSGCSSLTSLDLSSFDTSAVIYMSNMFSGCSSLTNLDLSTIDTSNVLDMNNMFNGCSSLTNLDISYSYIADTTTFINQLSRLSNLSNIKSCGNTIIEQYANDHGISVTCDE